MAKRPEVLVLDEPLASLDPVARLDFLQALMASVADQGITVLFSSHVVAELERVCDHLLLLDAGQMVLAGDIDALLAEHRLLVGPRTAEAVFDPSRTIQVSHADRQTTLLVRNGSAPTILGLGTTPGGVGADGDGLPSPRLRQRATRVGGDQVIWWTWRQHRTEILAILGGALCIAGVLLALGIPIHRAYAAITHCFDRPAALSAVEEQVCSTATVGFFEDVKSVRPITILLGQFPLLAVFIGAPLFAREFDAGTWQLAWTQSVPRLRWWVFKAVGLGAVVLIAVAIVTATAIWFRQPLDAVGSRLAEAFTLEGVVPISIGLFALLAGAAIGLFVRRPIGAVVVTALLALVLGIVLTAGVRPYYLDPLEREDPLGGGPIAVAGDTATDDWIVGSLFTDDTGRRYDDAEFNEQLEMAEEAAGDEFDFAVYAQERGLARIVQYQPAYRFWTFQWIEAGIYLALAAVATLLVTHKVRRGLA